jgi:hypothetical protein
MTETKAQPTKPHYMMIRLDDDMMQTWDHLKLEAERDISEDIAFNQGKTGDDLNFSNKEPLVKITNAEFITCLFNSLDSTYGIMGAWFDKKTIKKMIERKQWKP